MTLLSNASALLGKELRTEFRSRELLTTTVVFILIVIVLFSITLHPTTSESQRLGPGLLWVAFLFAASLMLQPCFLREQNNDTLSALRLAVLPQLVLALFLGSLGIAIPGTAFSAISAQARMRELMLPLLLLPLLTPILIASTEVTAALLEPEPALRLGGLGILITFDVVFLTALWLFGEYLLEE